MTQQPYFWYIGDIAGKASEHHNVEIDELKANHKILTVVSLALTLMLLFLSNQAWAGPSEPEGYYANLLADRVDVAFWQFIEPHYGAFFPGSYGSQQVPGVQTRNEEGSPLTPEQMEHAIAVQNGQYTSRPTGRGLVFRLASCDGIASPGSPCYFVVSGSGSFDTKIDEGMSPMSWNATITCGIRVYDSFGFEGAKLQQNVNVTFWSNGAGTPVTMNWGDLRGTATYHVWWYWTELSGPNPNPGWGIYIPATGTAYTTAGGLLVYAPPEPMSGWTTYVSSRLTINNSGWYCS